MEILGYGDRIPPGIFALHSAFDNALNFRGPRGVMVSLVSRKTGNGPLNVVLKHLPRAARRIKITKLVLYIDENRLEVDPEKNYDSAVPRLPLEPALFKKNLRSLRDFLGRNAPEKSMCFLFSFSAENAFRTVFERTMLGKMKNGAALIEAGDYAKGARVLRGLGFGLTPSGDDFLCGCLTGLNFVEANLNPAVGSGFHSLDLSVIKDAVYHNAVTKNFISGSFTYCAYNGRVNEKTGKLLAALAGFSEKRLIAAARASLRSGHTSGADFCAGLVYGCEAGLRAA
ncbi:MAG: hypothetical protein A2X28_05155 [Elusimicrobia bacterium GWA2_56_46]|nr:MAG: hypothetical protein A2X28_05155 [Elusimicrobia bacterium GWA2_56_46]OGR55252.1 MAG: hypothetical protein A2X39_04320 [Elusimicrobia bacterium GWC2_56_31]HBB66499.1 hypothetical protein [Elusimicrobiota bacterium]HBW22759.1 hypothetical protein [Elusimicrobiota bacterium]